MVTYRRTGIHTYTLYGVCFFLLCLYLLFRQSNVVTVLQRYIPTAATLGGMMVGGLTIVADLLGAIGVRQSPSFCLYPNQFFFFFFCC